jgi:hypothetical protein
MRFARSSPLAPMSPGALGARGVQRIDELVEKGHDARGRQLPRWSRRGNNRDYRRVKIGILFRDEMCTYEESA